MKAQRYLFGVFALVGLLGTEISLAQHSQAEDGNGWDRLYKFETNVTTTNAKACLEHWAPYGSASVWGCRNGKLLSYSRTAGLRNNSLPFENGEFQFSIVRTLEHPGGGRGETVVWLRNGADSAVPNTMQRVRVVIEEQKRGAVARLEEMRASGGYQVLAHMPLERYKGTYHVAVAGSTVSLSVGAAVLLAETTVSGKGGIYFFSSGEEGAWTDYDNLAMRSLD